MVYNLLEVLKDYEGKEIIKDESAEVKENFTFKDVLVQALNVTNPQDPTTPEDKAKAFFITLKAYKTPEAVEFTADEVAFILARIKANYPPITIGRSLEFFNQAQAN